VSRFGRGRKDDGDEVNDDLDSGIDDEQDELISERSDGEEAPGVEDKFDEDENFDEDDLGEDFDVDAAARNLMRSRKERKEKAPKPGRERPVRPARPQRQGPLARLYRGETRFDFVGRRKVWFTMSSALIVAGVISIILRGGLNLGIEFKGGIEWTVKAPHITQVQATNAMQAAGLSSPTVQLLGQGANQKLDVQADLNKLSATAQKAEELKVDQAIAKLTDTTVASVQNNVQTVGPSWGSSVTNKAIEALIIFFVVVGIYISIRFEPKMALAAFIAMLHDVAVAVGVYSLFNFQVTPDTVVAILTILGYSLYDTVVVFDRVRDNTKGLGSSGRMTYSQLINLSMNQTLARSINTSLVAILPVLAVLLVGAQLLGATTLQNYGLALFVGLLSGAYSSIFIAAPILAMLKKGESRWVSIENRLALKGGSTGSLSALDAATMSTQMTIAAGGQQRTAPAAKRTGVIRPGSAKQGASSGTGTAVMDRPSDGDETPVNVGRSLASNTSAARPRKGKGKRRR
jgi:preprotein translocase subunit SecF